MFHKNTSLSYISLCFLRAINFWRPPVSFWLPTLRKYTLTVSYSLPNTSCIPKSTSYLSHPAKAYKPLTSEASWEKGGGMVCFQHVEERKHNKINCICLYKYEESYISYVWVHGMKSIPVTNWLLCRNLQNASAGYICALDHLRNPGTDKTKSSQISRDDPVSGLVSRDVSADFRNTIIVF